MEKVLQKYGIGIFVRPPVLPQDMEAVIDCDAPEGVNVDYKDEEVVVTVPENFVSGGVVRLTGSGRVHVTIHVGKGSEVNFEESFTEMHDISIGLEVMEGAKVKYQSIQESENGFVTRTANVARDASLRWSDFVLGSDFARTFTLTKLVGENAETETDAIFFGEGESEFDLMHEVVHLASRTRSELRTRGVLDGKAKTVARGLVYIGDGAVGCSGRQRIDTLLLSSSAEIDAVPNLEIANNEVSCAHGATISHLDDAKLFYMMSRGMNPEEAKRAHIEAFLGIHDEVLLAKIMKNV